MNCAEEPRKISFSGTIKAIQPRFVVWRYRSDNRSSNMKGFNLFLEGEADGNTGSFAIAISEKNLEKMNFAIGDHIRGNAYTKRKPDEEYADYYRASGLKILEKAPAAAPSMNPPYTGSIPDGEFYDKVGCIQLSKVLWNKKCHACKYAGMGNVSIAWDYDRNIRKHRFESFCFGPEDCPFYKMGPARAVPYKGKPSAADDGSLDSIILDERSFNVEDDPVEIYQTYPKRITD